MMLGRGGGDGLHCVTRLSLHDATGETLEFTVPS